VAAPSLAVFKARLDGALSTLVWWKMSLLMARGWNQMISKVPSNPNHSVILWFYDPNMVLEPLYICKVVCILTSLSSFGRENKTNVSSTNCTCSWITLERCEALLCTYIYLHLWRKLTMPCATSEVWGWLACGVWIAWMDSRSSWWSTLVTLSV